MLESFYIHNFKNFGELTVPNLRRINLLVGKNGVGKSTFLEAVALYLSEGDDTKIRALLSGRGEGIVYSGDLKVQEQMGEIVKEHYLSLFKDREENYSKDFFLKVGETPDHSIKISQVFVSEYVSDGTEGIKQIQTFSQEEFDQTKGEGFDYKGLLIEKKKGIAIIRYSNRNPYSFQRKSASNCQFVYSNDLWNDHNAVLFDRISLSPLEEHVIAALNIINPSIERITFVSEDSTGRERFAMVSLKGMEKKVTLSSMGDGLNRILTIILSMLNAKDGVLLVDEFETGLHYSVQKQLWEIIFMLSEKLNIQVFVTSHSSDCLKAFSQVNKDNNGLLIRLEERNKGVVAVTYDNNDDVAFSSDNNIELR